MSLNIDDRFSTIEQFWQALNVDPSGLRVSEPNTALPAAFHVPVVLKRAVKRPAAVSVPKQSHAPRFRKPGASRSAVPKQPHVPHPGKLGGMSVVLLMLAIRVGAVLWSDTVGYHGSVSAAPTAVLLQKATPSKPAVVSTPSLTTSANLASTYNGTVYNMPAQISTEMSLTEIQQRQGNISGYFTGFQSNSPFTGSIVTPKHIQSATG